jgi:hypothetical protein
MNTLCNDLTILGDEESGTNMSLVFLLNAFHKEIRKQGCRLAIREKED